MSKHCRTASRVLLGSHNVYTFSRPRLRVCLGKNNSVMDAESTVYTEHNIQVKG